MTTTATKERPILFSGPMVRAILDGRKTQTRRVVKLRDPTATYSCFDDEGWPLSADEYGQWHKDSCPYGQPGDRLWVRETWAAYTTPSHEYPGDCDVIECAPKDMQEQYGTTRHDCIYQADEGLYGPWRPSIHMPRWASRITLEITDVRVERLNEISEADAVAEGALPSDQWPTASPFDSPALMAQYGPAAKQCFQSLWESINGEGSWAANPWVWAITFKRVQPAASTSKSCSSRTSNHLAASEAIEAVRLHAK